MADLSMWILKTITDDFPERTFRILSGGMRTIGRSTGADALTNAVGIDNALDESPPFAIGDGDTDLDGYVSGVHDPRGQFIYGKLTYRF